MTSYVDYDNKNTRVASHAKYVLSLGMLVLDFCVVVDMFPQKDSKQTALKQQVGGGGNAANTAVQLSRLGIHVRLISKVGNDSNGKILMDELQKENINTLGIEIETVNKDNSNKKENNKEEEKNNCMGKKTVTSFVLVANDTRTIISMPYEQRVSDVSKEFLLKNISLFDDVSLLHLDGRHLETATMAVEIAIEKNIEIFVEAELRSKALMKIHGKGLKTILREATYIISNKHYALELHGKPSVNNTSDKYCSNTLGLNKIEQSLLRMLDIYSKCKYLIVTLGDQGCICVGKLTGNAVPKVENMKHKNVYVMYHVDAYHLNPTENPIVDTTGAGDAFIGGFIEGIINKYGIETTLKRASFIGAMNCLKGYGARYNMQHKNEMERSFSKINSILCRRKQFAL
jgi:sugar/nucleoside kinase (ribokinase family)